MKLVNVWHVTKVCFTPLTDILGLPKDWLIYTFRSDQWSMEQLQLIWRGKYLATLQEYAFAFFPNEIVRQRFVLNQLFLMDEFEEPHTFTLSRFDPQLNGYVSMGRTNRHTPIYNRDIHLFDACGELKHLYFEHKRAPHLIVKLENILHLHTLLASEYHTPFLLPIHTELRRAIVDVLEYLTRVQLFMLTNHPQPLMFADSLGHFWESYEHTFFESLFQTMTVFLMQCPSGLLKLFEMEVTTYTGRTPTQPFEMSPECVCGCLFPPMYRYDETLPVFYQYLQQLNQAKLRHQQATSKIYPFHGFDMTNNTAKYAFCAPYRMVRYSHHWEQVPFDKLAILLKVHLHRATIVSSMGLLNHYWGLKNHHFDATLVFWEVFDFRGCPRTQTQSTYAMFPIQSNQQAPQIVHDLVDFPQHMTTLRLHELDDVPFGDLSADILVDEFCIDHRMVNRMVKVMNDFYMQQHDVCYRQHFSYLLQRQYKVLANALNVYDKLTQWQLMCRHEPHMATNFIYAFYQKIRRVLQLYPESKVSKNVLMCVDLHLLSANDCLTFGLINEQLYLDLQKEFCMTFYQLYLPVQNQFEPRLEVLLKSKAFLKWMKDPQLRQDYEVNQMISLIQ